MGTFPKYQLSDGREYTFGSNMTEEDATSLATAILSDHGCSYEILWPHERAERAAQGMKPFQDERAKIAGKAQAWVDQLDYQPSAEVESLLQQAFLAGWRAAPRGPRAVRP